jgi:hypothetical protein
MNVTWRSVFPGKWSSDSVMTVVRHSCSGENATIYLRHHGVVIAIEIKRISKYKTHFSLDINFVLSMRVLHCL